MRSCLKRLVFVVLRWIGLVRLFQFVRRYQIVIFSIHGVMDERDNPVWRPLWPRLSRDKLEEYMRSLSRRYSFISLQDAVEMLQGRKPVKPYSLVLTFDDGYRNNLTHALPILRQYGAPATFFIPTGFLDRPRPFWWDRLDYALQQLSLVADDIRAECFGMHLNNGNRIALQESYRKLRRTAKKQQMSDHEFLRSMERLAGEWERISGAALSDIQKNDDWSAPMTWDHVARYAGNGVTFGSHTVDHIRLGLVDGETARDQLIRSKQSIERHTRKQCIAVCYPNGSYTNETIRIAEKCGYMCQFMAAEGTNRAGDDVRTLKRIPLPTDMSATELLARVACFCRILNV